jgi:hypothetical protein
MFDKDGNHTEDADKMEIFETEEEMMDAFDEEFDIKLTEWRATIEDDENWEKFRAMLQKTLANFNTPQAAAASIIFSADNTARCESCGRL